jgi:hypothetical protein
VVTLMALLVVLGGCASIGDVAWNCSGNQIRATIYVQLESGGADAAWVRVTAWPGDSNKPGPGEEFEVGTNKDDSLKDEYPVTGIFPSKGTYTLKAWSARIDQPWANGKTKVVTACD